MPSLLNHEPGDIYFTNAEGEEVYLAGLHTWTGVQDRNGEWFDNEGYLNLQKSLGANFVRLWASDTVDDHGPVSPEPFLRSEDGRVDLSQFNPAFFDTLRARVEAANDSGLYASVMMFNGWAWREDNPYAEGNNANGIAADSGTVMSLRDPAVTAIQEAYIRKVVETVKDLPNVLYEVGNELDNNGDAWAWQERMLAVIKEADGNVHPAGLTAAEWWSGDRYAINGILAGTDSEFTSPDGADYMDGSVPDATGDKISLLDTDHLWGGGGSRWFTWEAFTRGHNIVSMTSLEGTGIAGASRRYPGKEADEADMREGIRQTLDVAGMIDMNDMKPQGWLSSTGFALADPADGEFVVYAPSGGEITLDTSAASGKSLRVTWVDVGTGAMTEGGTVAGGDGAQRFTAPTGGGAAALVLTDDGAGTPDPAPEPAPVPPAAEPEPPAAEPEPPVAQPSAPGSATAGEGADALVLKISQDAYMGDAQYTVSVDGERIGETFTASASRAAGESDTITLKGDWPAGEHEVSVTFLNDAWDGTEDTDRNLYVDGASYNGAAVSDAAAALMTEDAFTFAFTEAGEDGPPAPTPEPQPTPEPEAEAAPEPGPEPAAVDWNAIAAQVIANYEATGNWYM